MTRDKPRELLTSRVPSCVGQDQIGAVELRPARLHALLGQDSLWQVDCQAQNSQRPLPYVIRSAATLRFEWLNRAARIVRPNGASVLRLADHRAVRNSIKAMSRPYIRRPDIVVLGITTVPKIGATAAGCWFSGEPSPPSSHCSETKSASSRSKAYRSTKSRGNRGGHI